MSKRIPSMKGPLREAFTNTVGRRVSRGEGPRVTSVLPASPPQFPPLNRNILLVILDDIGKDFIGAYGLNQTPAPTPNLNAFASQGVRFTRAYSNPNCSPTRSLIQTGRYSVRTGMGTIVSSGVTFFMPDTGQSLPEMLPEHQCGIFGKWHLGNFISESTTAPTPDAYGWDHYAVSEKNPGAYEDWEKSVNGAVEIESVYSTTDTVDESIAWASAQTEKWFVCAAFHAAHPPNHVPPASLQNTSGPTETDGETNFRAMIQAFDTEFGRMLRAPVFSQQNCTIIVVGDNGTGTHIQEPFTSGNDKGTVYEGGIQTPLMVAGEAVRRGAGVDNYLTHCVDLYSTIVELGTGAIPNPALALDSVTMLDRLLRGSSTGAREDIYSEIFIPHGVGAQTWDEYYQAVRNAKYKLIHSVIGERPDEFYDLEADPYEAVDLYDLLGETGFDAEQLANYQALTAIAEGLEP